MPSNSTPIRRISISLSCACACWLGIAPAIGETPGDRVAAYGQVSPGERILTLALPYYLGAPQLVGELLVKEGDKVLRNQKVAITNNASLAAADVTVAKTRLTTSKERLNNLTSKKARTEELAIAKAEMAEAEAALARAEVVRLGTEVVSPVDGQVLKVLSYPGEANAAQGIFEIGETQAMRIKAELNVADAARVKPGALATVKSNAWRGEIAGKVTRVRPRVERSVLSAPSTFSNVDRVVVEATIVLETPERLAGLSGAEVTVLITAEPQVK